MVSSNPAAIRSRVWRAANLEKARAYARRYNYGHRCRERETLLIAQGGRCAACGTTNPFHKTGYKSGWARDHDHKTGRPRGLLCHHCNLILGFAKDNPRHLQQLLQYMEKHQ